MGKKSLAIILFIVVSIGFLYGFVTYNKRLSEMLGKKIDPSAVVLPENLIEPEKQETETPDEQEPESGEEEEDPLEEPDETSELVIIPYIIGLHQEEAVKALEENDLIADIHLEYVDGVEKDFVFYQRPPRNQEVPKGTTVSFSVSRGPYGSSSEENKAVVPSLIGKTRAQAENALKEADLLMKVKESYSSQVAKGNVISQDISSGKEVEAGSTVTITVSSGKEPVQQVVVPDVVGMTQSAAVAILESKGLKAAVAAVDSEIALGQVVRQSSASGSYVNAGATITISVSKGPVKTPVEPVDPPEDTPDPPEEPVDPEEPANP